MCIFRVDLGYFLHSHQHPLSAAVTSAPSPLPRAQPARSHSPSPNLQDSKLGNKRAAPPLPRALPFIKGSRSPDTHLSPEKDHLASLLSLLPTLPPSARLLKQCAAWPAASWKPKGAFPFLPLNLIQALLACTQGYL